VDIIVANNNPIERINTLVDIVFVMKNGKVYQQV
jgi:imidazolonepropionase-like amidohydrolase